MEQNAKQMTKQLFVLLKDYSKAGAARGENYQLVQNCFKVLQELIHVYDDLELLIYDDHSFFFASQGITILVKNVKSSTISDTQLQVLLGYAEEDIYDQSRQATAFGLLKVTRKNLKIKCVNCCQNLITDSFINVATCICLLQAILSRKLIVPEMEEVLKKVAKLSVTGSNAMIRIHCRQVLVHEGRRGTCFHSAVQ